MANQYVNKVEYGNDTLIDLTGDSVTPQTLLPNTTAHNRSGAPISGSASASVLPAVDTDNILGGGAGASTNTQAMLDGLADGYGAIRTDLSDLEDDMSDYHVTPSKNIFRLTLADLQASDSNNPASGWNGNVFTSGDATFTVKSTADGYVDEIVVNGSASSSDISLWLKFRKYTNDNNPTGCILASIYTNNANHSVAQAYRIGNKSTGAYVSRVTDYSGVITIPTLTSEQDGGISVFLKANTSVSNVSLKPMILTPADYAADPSYEPYWACMRDGMFPRSEQAVLGAKNLLINTYLSQTVNGVTITHNSDESLSFSGTATAQIVVVIKRLVGTLMAGQKYILSGIKGGSNSTYFMTYNDGTDNPYYINLYEGDAEFIAVDESTYTRTFVGLYIRSGQNMTGVIIKPMIRLASDPDNTYVPYAMTNRELTELKESSLTTTYTVSTGQGGNHLFKKSSVVQMILALEGVTAAAWTTLATVPQGYRPVATKGGYTTSGGAYPFFVTTGGAVQCGTALTSANVNFYMTWLTNE